LEIVYIKIVSVPTHAHDEQPTLQHAIIPFNARAKRNRQRTKYHVRQKVSHMESPSRNSLMCDTHTHREREREREREGREYSIQFFVTERQLTRGRINDGGEKAVNHHRARARERRNIFARDTFSG